MKWQEAQIALAQRLGRRVWVGTNAFAIVGVLEKPNDVAPYRVRIGEPQSEHAVVTFTASDVLMVGDNRIMLRQ